MSQKIAGSEAWWREKQSHGIPAVSVADNGRCNVTFWWRDPKGDESHSLVKKVWIYITGVTDHHQHSLPCSLARLTGTDAWYWQIELTAGWRGSYCLIPSECEDDFPVAALSVPPDRLALRQSWRRLLPQAIADPFNPHYWRSNRGHPVCALHMPDAPVQPGWNEVVEYATPRCINWYSQRLGNQRKVWIFSAGKADPANRPLAILLDGQFWAKNMPVWSALELQTRQKMLPPAVYLLIDAIDNQQRGFELTCNADFWLAIQEELLPLLRHDIHWYENASTTIVAGQSFGGLSALYAGLCWPESFGCVLSLSGSFWWPHRDNKQPGRLAEVLSNGLALKTQLRIYLEVGLREPIIHQAHNHLLPLLRQTQKNVFYQQIDGGHDALCWRGGLINGLSVLWSNNECPQMPCQKE